VGVDKEQDLMNLAGWQGWSDTVAGRVPDQGKLMRNGRLLGQLKNTMKRMSIIYSHINTGATAT